MERQNTQNQELDPIVARVIAARKEQGYSQQSLAEMAGISRRALAAIETGGNCTLTTLRSLCGALDLDLNIQETPAHTMPTLDEVVEDNRRERFSRERG